MNTTTSGETVSAKPMATVGENTTSGGKWSKHTLLYKDENVTSFDARPSIAIVNMSKCNNVIAKVEVLDTEQDNDGQVEVIKSYKLKPSQYKIIDPAMLNKVYGVYEQGDRPQIEIDGVPAEVSLKTGFRKQGSELVEVEKTPVKRNSAHVIITAPCLADPSKGIAMTAKRSGVIELDPDVDEIVLSFGNDGVRPLGCRHNDHTLFKVFHLIPKSSQKWIPKDIGLIDFHVSHSRPSEEDIRASCKSNKNSYVPSFIGDLFPDGFGPNCRWGIRWTDDDPSEVYMSYSDHARDLRLYSDTLELDLTISFTGPRTIHNGIVEGISSNPALATDYDMKPKD